MSDNNYMLEKGDILLLNHIINCINDQNYDKAMELIHNRLIALHNIDTPIDGLLKAQLAGLLIDIGNEYPLDKPIYEGIEIYMNNIDFFSTFIARGSIEYNLGNAKSGLFRVQRLVHNFKFIPKNISTLVEAKNHYWKAYKFLPGDNSNFTKCLITNLANTLDESCRVVESLQYYQQVLEEDPSFPQANIGRGEALIWLNDVCGSYTINQIQQAMNNFAMGAKSKDMPPWLIKQYEKKCKILKEVIEQHGSIEEALEHDFELTRKEADAHSDYRKFCLKNSLCLSEHSLYCNCVGSGSDNLTIPKTSSPICSEKLPTMELRLNRIKSEYAFARLLYYEACGENLSKWEAYNKEVSFTELYENEAVGVRPEMLRTSFRLCFGILDKIAHAVCDFFNLSAPNEPVAFERFWRPSGKRLSHKQKERWEKINQIENFPLLGLYSQATDLNSKDGEWSFFKEWRNALEHENLILIQSSSIHSHDIFGAVSYSSNILQVDFLNFKEKTLNLLQFTRSVIFNFVFCIRAECQKNISDHGVSITFNFKDRGVF